jgi:GH15 family glucan-1,4-alpha-glucosidase
VGAPAAGRAVSDPYLDVADHGAVGDGATVALVGRDGSVDWCCLPYLDSPSVFGALLDARRGGRFRVAPAGAAAGGATGAQWYQSDTNVLVTAFDAGGARVTVTDFMPLPGGVPAPGTAGATAQLFRVARCEGGAAAVDVEWAPRPGYARARPTIAVHGTGAVARAPDGASGEVCCGLAGLPSGDGGAGVRVDDDGWGPVVRARVPLGPGDVVSLTTWWGAGPPRWPAADGPALERATCAAWRGWAAARDDAECAGSFAGEWQPLVERSALVLKLLAAADTGAIAAAATTSLPAPVGGVRNWDYRFSWVRDAAFTAQALAAVGHRAEAMAFLLWMEEASMRQHARGQPARGEPLLRVLYPLRQGTQLDERVLEHLEGYRGSRPVRVGNGAAGQFQLDIYGELLAAADEITRLGGAITPELWRFLAAAVDECCRRRREPDEGIWEVRGPPRHFVHSKLMAWVALDRALAMADRYGLPGPTARWRRERALVRAEILEHGFDRDLGAFVQAYGARELDASLLVVPMVGFLPPGDPRVLGTIDRVRERLLADGFVERYDTRRGVDGLPPGEGAFGLATCWLVDALALAGRVDEARGLFEHVAGCANHVGLLAEQIEPGSRALMGNFPQAFTHLGLINSALYLAAAERRRTAGPPPFGVATPPSAAPAAAPP